MAVAAGPPIVLLFSLLAVVLGGRRSLPPLSPHSPLMVSLRMADDTPAVLPKLLFLSGRANVILPVYTPGGMDVGRCCDLS